VKVTEKLNSLTIVKVDQNLYKIKVEENKGTGFQVEIFKIDYQILQINPQIVKNNDEILCVKFTKLNGNKVDLLPLVEKYKSYFKGIQDAFINC